MKILVPNNQQFYRYYSKHCKYLKLQGLRPKTVDAYSRAIKRIGNYFDSQIDNLTRDQLLDYFTDLKESHSWSTVKLDLYGLRFFYTHVLEKTWEEIPLIKSPKIHRIPDIVTRNEASKLFAATTKLSYRVFFYTIYSMGLRIGEGINLKYGDIDSTNMRVHVRDAKGNKDRLVPLPKNTLNILRDFCHLHKHPHFIFPSRKRGFKNARLVDCPLDKSGIQVAIKKVVEQIGLKKKISCHSLRHSYATHLLEAGIGLIELQHILGHVSLLTTTCYIYKAKILFDIY